MRMAERFQIASQAELGVAVFEAAVLKIGGFEASKAQITRREREQS